MRRNLDEALSLYSESNPRVRMLQARITRLEERVETRAAEGRDAPEDRGERAQRSATLELQLRRSRPASRCCRNSAPRPKSGWSG